MCLLWWLWVKASSYLHSDILNRCNRRYPLLLLWVRAVCCICTGLPHPKPLPEMSVILCCSSNCISPYFWSSCAFALVPRNSSDCSLTKKNFFFFSKISPHFIPNEIHFLRHSWDAAGSFCLAFDPEQNLSTTAGAEWHLHPWAERGREGGFREKWYHSFSLPLLWGEGEIRPQYWLPWT